MKRLTQQSLDYTKVVLSCFCLTGILALPSNSQTLQHHYWQQQNIAQSQSASTWKSYTNSTYRITLRYPKNWQKATEDGFSSIDGYEGSNGFFKLSAMGSDSLQNACQSEAKHRLQPYGSNPKVQNLRLQGQSACLILPSSDQIADAKNIAAVIVRYPQPVRINNTSYPFFVLWADKTHIQKVAATLRFMPRK